MNSDLLFVYGLLRKMANHEMSKFLDDKARFMSEATYQGKLYLIDYYPGIISSESSSDIVKGDVFKLIHPSILKELDHFEGIGSEYQSPNEYRREIREVKFDNGKKELAWIYLYNWPVEPKNQIHSGDFLHYFESIK